VLFSSASACSARDLRVQTPGAIRYALDSVAKPAEIAESRALARVFLRGSASPRRG